MGMAVRKELAGPSPRLSLVRANTKDEPGESHRLLVVIAKGARLTEDRVRQACLTDPRIFQHTRNAVEEWSVWRKEPESRYQLFVFGGTTGRRSPESF
jgi:hypothetical protein